MKMIAAVGLVAGVLALEATARPVRFIDYVQTDGKDTTAGEAVVLDYVPKAETVVEADVTFLDLKQDHTIFCSCGRTDSISPFTLLWINDKGYRWNYNRTTAQQEKNGVSKNVRHTVKVSGSGLWIDGTKSATISVTPVEYEPLQKLMLFATGAGAIDADSVPSKQYSKLKLHRFCVWEGDVLKLALYPCLDDNGRPGLYDDISGTTYYNCKEGKELIASADAANGPAENFIMVDAEPAEYGEPTPAYGTYKAVTTGQSYTFKAPTESIVSADRGASAVCTGWRLTRLDGTTYEGVGTEATIEYTDENARARLTWIFEETPLERKTYYVAKDGSDEAVGDADHPFATIAKAVSVAYTGDTVIVRDGVFDVSEPIHIDRGLTLKSEHGADKTVVRNVATGLATDDVLEIGRVLNINHPGAKVEGFALTGGRGRTRSNDSYYGAGDYGLAVLIGPKGGWLVSSLITNNVPSRGCRGAVGLRSHAAVVSNCTITANNATSGYMTRALGVYVEKGLVTHCNISSNKTTSGYGTMNWGGAVGMEGGRLTHCTIVGNEVKDQGAGLYVSGAKPVIDNCLFAGNEAKTTNSGVPGSGGGAYFNAAATVSNCTFRANKSARGSAITVNTGVAVDFYGCIFTGGQSGGTSTGDAWPEIDVASSTFAHCISTKELSGSDCFVETTAETLSADGITPNSTSKAVDRCPPDDYADLTISTDLLGNPRLSGEKVDAGCVEFQHKDFSLEISPVTRRQPQGGSVTLSATAKVKDATVYEYAWSVDGGDWSDYSVSSTLTTSFADAGVHTVRVKVRVDGTPMGDPASVTVTVGPKTVYVVPPADGHAAVVPYASWDTAATNIADAVSLCADGSTVWVSNGEYRVRAAILVDYAVLLQSVNGADVTVVRNVRKEKDETLPVARLMTINHAGAHVQGLTFCDGTTETRTCDDNPDCSGAGVLLKSGVLDACVITNCTVGMHSSSVLVMQADESIVTNCTIAGNLTQGYAAYGTVKLQKGLLTHSRILCNTNTSAYNTSSYGAGVIQSGGTLSHCEIRGNVLTKGGGGGAGVFVSGQGAQIDNCLIADNAAPSGAGGGIHLGPYDATEKYDTLLVNCTFVGNTAEAGGGVYASVGGERVLNCIIQDNAVTKESSLTNINTVAAHAEIVSEPLRKSVRATGEPGYSYCVCPEILQTVGSNNVVAATAFCPDTLVPAPHSAAVNAGSAVGYDFLFGPQSTDFAGRPRVKHVKPNGKKLVDAGCYESDYLPNGLMLMVR